ncbi:molecular chaperone TorD family protein [Aliarcobacter skirrowii]|jgi:TorA maturation chaperone TorD|uniref:Molecular chaperone TorD family protein n=1 Tax=Aliarcobacter skirrowii TaxID=28200 RepID=A0AAW9DCN2_9BACT|nr:molecular chaperone TorD family protein [Aliarcobacter skirrowii]MDX4039802.1 molecular chaperone TorD family protein [Aliarcobacter skirrowii]MDX4070063.1 molecular chaperone TorD family protein [Aliarcobacter skirrowii]MDY0180674.1 molecular chaperone TorD family protein [Aliarcobacter skirrowii]
MKNDLEINKARALYYNLFSRVFVYPKDMDKYKELITILNIIKESPLDENSQKSIINIINNLDKDSNKILINEFDEVFSNLSSDVVRNTASFYDEGIENGTKRLEMIQFLAKTKIRRDENNYFENEDSVGFILAVLSELIEAVNLGDLEYKNTIHCIFEQILNPFVDEFTEDLYKNEKSVIYKDIAVIFSSFIAFERLYLEVKKPHKKEKISDNRNSLISEEEKERRAKNKAMKANGLKGGYINDDLEEVICSM